MIPKKIHQIYFNLTGKKINEIKEFYKSHNICKSQKGFEYKLWSERECEELINNHYPNYKKLYFNFRFEIQKIDFIRFCILHKYGGFYIDLDMMILKPLNKLTEKKYIFHNVKEVNKNWSFIENDFMGSIPNSKIWLDIMRECEINYKEKELIDIYKVWKGRFIMQTTGPRFLSRYIKNKFPKYKPMKLVYTKQHKGSNEFFYLKDLKMNTWIRNKVL